MSEYAYHVYLTRSGERSVDVTELVQTLTWSGNVNQVGREVRCGLLADRALPLEQGALVTLRSGGKSRFLGPLVSVTRDSQSAVADLGAVDRSWYLTQNEGWYKFQNTAPEQAAASIASTYGLPTGSIAKSGVTVSRKFPGVPLDKILTTLYTLAGEKNGKRYLVGFDGDGRLSVRQKADSASLSISSTMSVTSTWDIGSLQNSVILYTDTGKLVRRIEDEPSIALSGRLSHVLTQRTGEDVSTGARAWLEDHGVQRKLTVQCMGDPRLITGEAVILRDMGSGVSGLFWIDSDSHTWKNGIYTTKLTLNFRNVSSETTAGSEIK
ncbi:hypothetical protein H8790_06870 [Oscillibacter hominis]|uniref:YqbQ/XkdQ domain-containing protein n=1 Tax=Oscillibacter hominis TaxID=2763056 RepID=A0A7G9B829_9FIRM|nr:hypothetical protein [Oscillibacter hominis]QNL45710.1 hypothetical protein H8790_06870 [Oscillibacter hominis]